MHNSCNLQLKKAKRHALYDDKTLSLSTVACLRVQHFLVLYSHGPLSFFIAGKKASALLWPTRHCILVLKSQYFPDVFPVSLNK